MIDNLTTASPVEVDTVLAVLYRAETGLLHKVDVNAHYVRDAADIRLASDRQQYRENRTVGTTADAEAVLQARIDAGGGGIYSPAARAADTLGRLTAAREALAANRAEQAPLHAEFTRRGRWTRAFLVLASGGHVHSSMHCVTCYPTTRYGWLPQESGKDEAAIIVGAGSDACSICFPSAPVETAGPRRTLHKSEVEALSAREAKVAKRAAKDAKDVADALIDPATGQPIKDSSGWAVKEKAATSDYVESAAYLAAIEKGYQHVGRREQCERFVARFTAAMAAKRGVAEADVVSGLAKKVVARVRRDY